MEEITGASGFWGAGLMVTASVFSDSHTPSLTLNTDPVAWGERLNRPIGPFPETDNSSG